MGHAFDVYMISFAPTSKFYDTNSGQITSLISTLSSGHMMKTSQDDELDLYKSLRNLTVKLHPTDTHDIPNNSMHAQLKLESKIYYLNTRLF